MSERLVGLGHLVRVFFLLYRSALAVRGVYYLGGEFILHALPRPVVRVSYEPPKRQRELPVRSDLYRHLIRRAADPSALRLKNGLYVFERLLEDLRRVSLCSFLYEVQRAVAHPFGGILLALYHDHVHELVHTRVVIFRVRQDFSFRCFSLTSHCKISHPFLVIPVCRYI